MSYKTISEREEQGREARRKLTRSSHAEWAPGPGRRDPVELLMEQNQSRVPWLVPVRHSRMRVSPFTFYRGTARIMAADLATLPDTGLEVQLAGDCHLSNLGAYASPERQLVFDANDFDETLCGPWEWDLKRLAVSFYVAGRHLGFTPEDCRSITAEVAVSYRDGIRVFGEMRFLELWYEHTKIEDILDLVTRDKERIRDILERFERKARSKNSLQALNKLAEHVEGRFRIRSDRPVLVPIREVFPEYGPGELDEMVRSAFSKYLETLRDDRQSLLERYELIDIALKVVGVGSVGTLCFVLLLQGRDENDPLFLQAKQATASVLEEFLGPSPYEHHGQRVVQGQRQIQAQSDIFLGWATGDLGPHYYFRQLRDWKRSFHIESAGPRDLHIYARLCGQVLARGHARSGDAIAIGAYMGGSSEMIDAIVAFSEKYAEQTVADFEAFQSAIADGRLEVAEDL